MVNVFKPLTYIQIGIFIMKHSLTFPQILISVIFTLLSLHAFAAPGALINSPLIVGTSAPSNIMFLIDNSGSMDHVVEESTPSDPDKFNASKTYITDCATSSTSTMVPTGQNVFIFFTSGRPYMRYYSNGGTAYTIDYNASNKSTGDRCFNPTTNYSASLHAKYSGGTRPPWYTALYTGNYLNWYFKYDNTNNGGSVGKNWTSTAAATDRYKPGTATRKVIARDSMTKLVTALESTDVDIRLGLASFYSGKGAKIFDEIKYLDKTQRDSINTHIKSLGDGGGTPLAESLHDLGRYFIGDVGTAGPLNGNLKPNAGINDTNGSWHGNITLHPNTTTTSTPPLQKVDVDAVFNRSPSYYSSSASKASPIQYWCQSNFVVATTDGLPTNDQNIPSYLQDYDSDCTTANSCTTSTFDRKSLPQYIYESPSSGSSDYLDDVAQAMFEIDLRPDINDYGTPTNPSGDPVKNNVITYTIAFADQDALNNQLLRDAGVQGGGEAIQATDGADLIKKFTEVTNKILATTSSAAAATFNTGSLQNNSTIFQTLFTTSRWSGDVFSYPLSAATGNINFACTISSTGCWSAASRLDNLAYSGSTFLDNRQIITFDAANKKGIAFKTPVDFTAPTANEITTMMINDLCAGPDAPLVASVACTSATASAKTNSQQYIGRIVDYIRGDRTFEAITTTPTFRTRQSILGDVMHATPAFAGTPSLRWPQVDSVTNKFGVTGNRYSDYKTLKKNRTKVLYVSANDGMLHAFRTETDTQLTTPNNQAGDELFAFMPSFIFSNQTNEGYHFLVQPTYTHKYYLDLSPTYSDIYGKVKDTSQTNFKTPTADWHTILIGGSRGGVKKGIFALDVTDPLTITESNAANKVLWEFTSNDDPDLGFTYSKPTIALTNAIDADGLHRWAAIFGNGYQSDASATLPTGATCHAILFVVFLDGGLDGTWTLGTNPNTADYMKIDTKVGTASTGKCNGLSTPSLYDTDGDRILDRVYAGDVQGNMWAFDFTCKSTGGCNSADFNVAYNQGLTPKPLFTAKDPLGNPQPITVKPGLARNSAVKTTATNKPNLMVLFATGQYLASGDAIGTSKLNTVYGIWDSGKGGLTDDRSNSTASTSLLIEQIMSDTNKHPEPLGQHKARDPVTLKEYPVRITTSNTVDWTKKYGWFADLKGQDTINNFAEERVVVDLAIRSNILFFNTAIPDSLVCGVGGDHWIMGLDYIDGATPTENIFDANRDGAIDNKDSALSGEITVGVKLDKRGILTAPALLGGYQYTQSSDKSIDKRKVKVKKQNEGRLSWRELHTDN